MKKPLIAGGAILIIAVIAVVALTQRDQRSNQYQQEAPAEEQAPISKAVEYERLNENKVLELQTEKVQSGPDPQAPVQSWSTPESKKEEIFKQPEQTPNQSITPSENQPIVQLTPAPPKEPGGVSPQDSKAKIILNGIRGCSAYLTEPVNFKVEWSAPASATNCTLYGHIPDQNENYAISVPVDPSGSFIVTDAVKDPPTSSDWKINVGYGEAADFTYRFDCALDGQGIGDLSLLRVGEKCPCFDREASRKTGNIVNIEKFRCD